MGSKPGDRVTLKREYLRDHPHHTAAGKVGTIKRIIQRRPPHSALAEVEWEGMDGKVSPAVALTNLRRAD